MDTLAQPVKPAVRTLTNRDGKRTVETWMTDQEACDMLRTLPKLSDFGQSLLNRIRRNEKLSSEQMFWVHTLVVEFENKKNNVPKPAANVGSMKKVIEMFNHAKSYLKYPRIWLKVDGVKIRLSLAGSKSKYEGSIQIKADLGGPDREWLGRVSPEGEFVAGRQTLPNLRNFLQAFANDPVTVAKEYGLLMGSCCFCNKTIWTEESKAVGYGPDCADHYGLPWGN